MMLRYLVERAVLVAIAVLVWRCWCAQGVFAPNRVDSGSMAPSILGMHRWVECNDCGFHFAYGTERRPVAARAVCPNCGYSENTLDDAADLPGDGLLLDRSVYSWRTPRRWEVVAFRHPAQTDQIYVKRVVGLPGERVEIREGDVYVDGHIRRKTLEQQRAMAVLVHDADHQPTLSPTPPARWGGSGPSSQWGEHGGRFAHALALEQDAFDWLVYRHWRRLPNQPGQVEPGPVEDVYGYNQKHPRRAEEVAPVRDLLVRFDLVRTWGDGVLAVRMTDGATEFEFRLAPATGRYEALLDGRVLPDGVGRLPRADGPTRFEVSMIDHQYLVAWDGDVIGRWAHDPAEGPYSASETPIQIGAMRLGVVMERLRLYRDLYYTQPSGVHARWGLNEPVQLGPDEFFVLGDNSPVSEDSRTWAAGPAVPAASLIGRPLLVHFPLREVRLGPWEFQVPDPARMRYIP